MDSYYLYQRQYRETGGAWKNTSIYSVDGWQTQPKVVAKIDPSECDEWNPDEGCKVKLTLSDGYEVCIPCDGSRTVTRADLGEYANHAIIAEFGCCIDTIDGVFQGDTKIQKAIIPDCITAITEASFYGTPIQGIVFPGSMNYIGNQANKLAKLEWARFVSPEPPTLAAKCSLGGDCPIYVPPAYVETYRSASIWNEYDERIQPWNGQVETDYPVEIEPTPIPPTPTGTTYVYWIEDSTEFVCSGTDKYHLEYAWTSSTGSEGSYTKTDQSRTGNLWETGSTDCGYVPPYSGPKFTLTLTGGSVVSAECDSTSAITSAETTPYSAQVSSAVIGGCVYTIGDKGLRSCYKMTSVTIPDSVTAIGNEALYYCSGLTSISLPQHLSYIGDYAFHSCEKLTSVTIPDSVHTIGRYAFAYCREMTSIQFPKGITIIRSGTCESCESLSSVVIPSGVTEIQDYAFDYCHNLTSVTLSQNLTAIGVWAFATTNFQAITLPNSLTSIAAHAFRESSIQNLTLPSGVTSIGEFAFNGCLSLTSITIPNSLTSIPKAAFQNCRNLPSVTIPNSVTSIGDYAFRYCSGLTSITVETTVPPNIGSSVFSYTNGCPIHVPAASVDTYKAATNWSSYASRIQAIP